MAATTQWYEQNGAGSGSPAQGAPSTISQIEYKNIDDTSTPRASAPIPAGQNSFGKFNYLRFTGTFNQVSAVLFGHTAGTFGTGISLRGLVTSTYTQPSTTALASSTDMTAPSAITSGANVLVSPTSPAASDASTTLTAPGYTQYCVTQMQTTTAAAAGDTTTATLTIQYNEN